MARRVIYLDHNATAPVRPEVRDAVLNALEEPANPSSVHVFGRKARNIMEASRAEVAALVGAEPPEVVFTSGGTEANNLALRVPGIASLVVSATEHDSVLSPARGQSETAGIPVFTVPARSSGQVDLAALEDILRRAPRPALLALMAANNETGVIQPLTEAVALARAAGAYVLVDAVQAAGRIPLDFAALAVDMMSISGHKLGGATGVGALVVRGDMPFSGGQMGGGQELGRRAGTENLPGIAGFAAAAGATRRDIARTSALRDMRDELERRILDAVPDAVIHGAAAPRLCNTACVGMPGVEAEIQVMALDLAGIAVSAGAACSSGKVRASHVLTAMGVDPSAARNAVRFSFGWNSRPEDAAEAADAWIRLWQRRNRPVAG